MRGARTRREALVAARSVANSPAGEDRHQRRRPELGADHDGARQVARRGWSQDRVAIAIGDEPLVEKGMLRAGRRLDRVREIMGGAEYTIAIDLGLGRGEDRVWTSDLSEEYVRINSKYTT